MFHHLLDAIGFPAHKQLPIVLMDAVMYHLSFKIELEARGGGGTTTKNDVLGTISLAQLLV